MYPGRRFALPWAISFCPFGAAGSMVDWYLPGPSTPAEGVPGPRAYEPQDATYRGLRPRQRVCQPFGPMGPQDCYLPGPSTPTLFRRPYPIVRPLRIQKAVRGYLEQERRDNADTASVQAARRRVRVALLGTIALHAYW
jgi:hypothetical protein